MADMHTFFTCIPHFFRVLWASFFGFLSSKHSVDGEACDIETGIPSSAALKESVAGDINLDIEAAAGLLVSPKDDFVDIDLKAASDPSSRGTRPTRPSCRDPVKSRIVNSALKQVQDKTIGEYNDCGQYLYLESLLPLGVVKPVVVTPGTVTAVACSVRIEYYDGPVIKPSALRLKRLNPISALPISGPIEALRSLAEERSRIQIGYTRSRPKQKQRAVQFGNLSCLPFIFHTQTVSALPVRETSYTDAPERRHKNTRAKKRRESLFDILDQFPAPPTYVPPVPPVAATPAPACGPPIENFDQVDLLYGACQSPAVSEKSASSSDSDSVLISGSASDDTAQTSAPGTPDTDEFFFSVSGATNAKADGPDTQSPQSVTNFDDAFPSMPSERGFLRLEGMELVPKGLPEPVQPMEVPVPPDFFATKESLPFFAELKDVANHYEDLSDGFTDAGSGDGDGFEGRNSREDSCHDSKPSFCDAVGNSQMYEPGFAADDLHTQVESQSFDSNQRPDFDNETIAHCQAKALFGKSVAPLRIVKKSKPRYSVDAEGIHWRESERWEESMDKVLKAFREAETDDDDFRDLFYRSSASFSQSSLVDRREQETECDCSISDSDAVPESQEDRTRRFNESFDSIEKSVEEILAVLGLPDPIAVTTDEPASVSLSGGMIIKKFALDDVKPAPLPVHRVDVLGHHYEDPYTWIAMTDDDDSKNESEGEHNQWSDMLELNAYLE
ncbi:hypothetical protein GALMADRAFT_228503 [Galerina marginata CBS 339.88]|uniref:Uncharacterized protein n=1 Tax=Galerina marginata (strain CBS 339.88) TaxID=685588 RepID=A0A067SPD7_GALM3|nr:hypothetical protein GALMADRAFT_228503 [Galerina marginata CBS 339.88]